MSTNITRFLLVSLALFAAGVIRAEAQFDFTALDGLPTAQTEAESSLGADAYPVLIGAPGQFDFQGFPLRFDLESGRASVWAYVFYSPSKEEFLSLIVLRILSYQVFQLGSLPFPIPTQTLNELNISGTYANSDDMLLRVETDSAYLHYRSDLPKVNPTFVSLTQLLNTDSLSLPIEFPVGQATWTLLFQGGGDSSMTCFVASETGEAFCRRIYGLPTSGVPETPSDEKGKSMMTVSPNPAKGQVTVSLSGIATTELSASSLLLYNEAGERVLDLTESLKANDYREATFPTLSLAPGLYYCTLLGPTATQHVGVIVVE